MPIFKYKALTDSGKIHNGKLDGISRTQVISKLKKDGLYVTSITELKSDDTENGNIDPLFLFSRVSKKELSLFFRQLSVMLRSGVSLVYALTTLYRQSRRYGFRKMVSRILTEVEGGRDFSEAMKKTGKFSLYDIAMVKAAEASGELDIILESVAEQMDKNMEFRGQLITSMIYPVMVTIMSVGVMIFLSVFVIPKFTAILGGKGKSLPYITQLMLDTTKWIQLWWGKIVGGAVITAAALPFLKKTEGGALIIDWILLRIPVIGSIIQSGFVVNFSRNLSILLRSGVPLSDAVITVRDTLKNAVAARVLNNTYEGIIAGEGMADTLRQAGRTFPPMVTEMVSTGEETGEMVQVLELTAQIFQKMLESFVKRMNAMIEPLLIIVLGGMVGFVIIALMIGVMSMY